MANLRFNARVGPARVGSRTSEDFHASVHNVRRDMQGVINRYRRLINHIETVSPDILLEALEPTFEQSKTYCPKDTGALVNSGYLEITQFRGVPTVEIGYGRGGNPSYAVNVHENLEWRHKYPTRAKWLQVALTEDEANIQNRIVNAYRTVFA
jgi:hypothetical protein